jgi:hypothetical protein
MYQCIWFNLLYMMVLMFSVFEMKFNFVKFYVRDSALDL